MTWCILLLPSAQVGCVKKAMNAAILKLKHSRKCGFSGLYGALLALCGSISTVEAQSVPAISRVISILSETRLGRPLLEEFAGAALPRAAVERTNYLTRITDSIFQGQPLVRVAEQGNTGAFSQSFIVDVRRVAAQAEEVLNSRTVLHDTAEFRNALAAAHRQRELATTTYGRTLGDLRVRALEVRRGQVEARALLEARARVFLELEASGIWSRWIEVLSTQMRSGQGIVADVEGYLQRARSWLGRTPASGMLAAAPDVVTIDRGAQIHSVPSFRDLVRQTLGGSSADHTVRWLRSARNRSELLPAFQDGRLTDTMLISIGKTSEWEMAAVVLPFERLLSSRALYYPFGYMARSRFLAEPEFFLDFFAQESAGMVAQLVSEFATRGDIRRPEHRAVVLTDVATFIVYDFLIVCFMTPIARIAPRVPPAPGSMRAQLNAWRAEIDRIPESFFAGSTLSVAPVSYRTHLATFAVQGRRFAALGAGTGFLSEFMMQASRSYQRYRRGEDPAPTDQELASAAHGTGWMTLYGAASTFSRYQLLDGGFRALRGIPFTRRHVLSARADGFYSMRGFGASAAIRFVNDMAGSWTYLQMPDHRLGFGLDPPAPEPLTELPTHE